VNLSIIIAKEYSSSHKLQKTGATGHIWNCSLRTADLANFAIKEEFKAA